MKKFAAAILVFLAAIVLLPPAFGQTIKIATIAPENSPWGEGLKRMAGEWSRITQGRVRVNLFFGGIAGSEEESIRKMRIGQLQGLALTSSGLNHLSDAALTLSAPRLVRSDAELDLLLDRMADTLSESLRAQNVEVLTWSKGGWIRLFANREIRTPDELKQLRLVFSTSEAQLNSALQTMGFRGVALSTNEVLTGLNSRLVDAFLYSPLGAAGFQWFAVAPYMLELEITPFLGAIVIDSRTWRQVPAQYRDQLLASAQAIGLEIGNAIRSLEDDAINTMKQYGLKVVSVNSAQRRQWEEVFERGIDLTLGSVFNRAIYERAQGILRAAR